MLKGYRMLRGPFFVSGAEADGDVGVPDEGRVMARGRAVATRYNLGPCRRMGLPRSMGRKITISKIYLFLELLYATGHSWYLDRFG